MRKNNPNRVAVMFKRMNDRCGCEHQDHFHRIYGNGVGFKRKKHPHGRRKANGGWAMYVGHVCKDCEETCMKEWMMEDHVCGEGDCHRGDGGDGEPGDGRGGGLAGRV